MPGVVQKTVPLDPLSPDELAPFPDDSFCLPSGRVLMSPSGLTADQRHGCVKSV